MDYVEQLVKEAGELFGAGPRVLSLKLPPRLVLVGDTHGQIEDLLWIFFKYGEPSPTNVSAPRLTAWP